MKTAGIFLLVSALLHIVGSILTGFSGVGLFLLFPAVLYTAFWFGLMRWLTWVAWIALICMLGGMGGTVLELFKGSIVPDWVLWGIVATDFVVAVSLANALFARRNA